MTPTRVSDAKQIETLDGPTVREALGAEVATTAQSTELAVPVADQWQSLAGAFDDGTAAFINHFGLTMPRLRSDFGRNGKGWVDDLTGDTTNHLRIVILAQPPSRTFWLKSLDDGGGGRPDCKSTNLLADRPDDNVPEPQSAKCSTCPHSQWGEAEDGSPIKPACSEAVNVLAYDLDGERYVWLAFRGMSINPFQKYVSALYSRKMVPFGVETVVTLDEKEKGSLKFLVAKFAIGPALDFELATELRGVAKKAMATWQSEAEAMAASEVITEARESEGPFDSPPPSDGDPGPQYADPDETF